MIALQLPLSYSKRGCGSIDNHSSMEQQPLSYVYSMKPGRSYLFAEFLEFICNKLYLGSNDDLYGGLAWTHHASHTGGLDQLFIDLGIILDLKTESGNAVINRSHILRTANAFQNDLRDNAATNEPCAASYCISLSDSMGNRALTTKEA